MKVVCQTCHRSYETTEFIAHLNSYCHKEMPNGKICGKPTGTCIHNFVGTKFGSQNDD